MDPVNDEFPIYISVTFWGQEYRRYFLDFCLASLLAPQNIPALTHKGNSRLLIATPDEDWDAMQSEPAFQAAKALIPIEHVVYNLKPSQNRTQIMQAMSNAHRLLADRMFTDRAHGFLSIPTSFWLTAPLIDCRNSPVTASKWCCVSRSVSPMRA